MSFFSLFFALRTFLIMIALCPACAVFSYFNCPSGLWVCAWVCVRLPSISRAPVRDPFPRGSLIKHLACSRGTSSVGLFGVPHPVEWWLYCFFLFFFFSPLQYTQLHVRNCMRMGIEVITHTHTHTYRFSIIASGSDESYRLRWQMGHS